MNLRLALPAILVLCATLTAEQAPRPGTGRSGAVRIATASRRRPGWPSSGRRAGRRSSGRHRGLGGGYGAVAVRGARVFVQGLRGRDTMVHSLNLADGKYLWSKNLGAGGSNDRGSGPRSTPTLDGDRLYVLTESGDLWCLREDGTEVWHRNILSDFPAATSSGCSANRRSSTAIASIVTPGGRDAGMVALDKMTGKTIWTSKELSDDAGYSSAVVVDVEGVRAYTTFTASAAVGVRASDGKVMWRYPRAANGTANIATPVVHENKVFYTSDYGTGGGLVTLQRQERRTGGAKETYFTRDMQNHHGGVVLVNGTLYGFSDAILTRSISRPASCSGAIAASARAR